MSRLAKQSVEIWNRVELKECISQKPDYGVNAAAVDFSTDLPAYVRITDISEDGQFLPAKRTSVDHVRSGEFVLKDGDLVFARTGASVGKSYRYTESDGTLVFAGFLIRIRPDKSKLLPGFLSAYAHTKRYYQWVKETSPRSGQPGINSTEYASLTMDLPSIPEQKRIVTVLETWDKAIDLLEKKIELKEQLKRGLMQQLLTGKKRLPGFESKWKKLTLGDTGSLFKGKGISKKELVEHGVSAIRYGELYTKHDVKITSIYSEISEETAGTSVPISNGDILFAGSGETIDEIGKSAVYLYDDNCFVGGDTIILRPRENNSLFLSYLLNSNYVRRDLRRLGQGQSVVHLYKKDLQSLIVTIPERSEQDYIVSILEAVDGQVTLLKEKHDVIREQKKYLLNNLVTGKIRTPEDMKITEHA